MKDIIERGVEEYNRYRSPEARAEIANFDDNGFTIIFRGPFCRSCGIYDYFEDLIYILKRRGRMDLEIVEIEELNEMFQVKYMIKRQ